MKNFLTIIVVLTSIYANAQETNPFSPFEARHWNVVLEYPEMKDVVLQKDITYLEDGNNSLHVDVYTPPNLKPEDKLPAVIFLNGIGDAPNQPKVKSWKIYSSWPRLMATQGFVGISMETDGTNVHGSFDALFNFLSSQGNKYHIDADRLGVYAASANTTQSGNYLMKEHIYKGIKAAVLYYGNMPTVPLRKDLPVWFVVSEGDVRGNAYQSIWNDILKNKAPWTIKMASNLPHAFDAFTDSDEARIVIKETISFWKNHLEPVLQPSWQKAPEREIVESQYWRTDDKTVRLLKDWFLKNPDSKDKAAYELYARSLVNVGNYAEGEVIHKKRLEQIDPTNVFILFDLVIVSHALGKHDQAENYLAQYTKTTPLQRNNYTGLAFNLHRLKKYSDAIRYYDKALAIEPKGTEFYNAACAYTLIDQRDKAFEYLQKAIEIGFASKQQFENDTDLESLKTDARWKALLEKLQ